MSEGGSPAEQPPTAGQQVDAQVMLARVTETVGAMFGGNTQMDSGGGGAGDSFQFESLEQLDALIGQWKAKVDAITARGERIVVAQGFIEAPAGDIMSQFQAKASVQSLDAMMEHNDKMRIYAANYVKKLTDARATYANTEDANAIGLHNQNKG